MRRIALLLAVAALSLVADGSRPAVRAPRVARAQRLVVLRPAEGLGALVAGFGDLWVDDRWRQRILRLDGRSERVRAAIPVAGRVALAAGAGALWALPSGGGYGLGLRGDRVRARIALTTASGAPVLGFGVQAADRAVWVWGPHDILRVDPRAARVTAHIATGADHGELTGFAAGGGQLVAGTADGHLLRFDARTGRRSGVVRFALLRPVPKALLDGRLLFTAAGLVGVADAVTGELAWRHRLGFRASATLGADGLIWVYSSAAHDAGDRVTALRLDTGRVVTSGVVPAFGSTGIAALGAHVSLATAGGRLLVLAPFPA
jgi:outer membrane protein assembly factor BamB